MVPAVKRQRSRLIATADGWSHNFEAVPQSHVHLYIFELQVPLLFTWFLSLSHCWQLMNSAALLGTVYPSALMASLRLRELRETKSDQERSVGSMLRPGPGVCKAFLSCVSAARPRAAGCAKSSIKRSLARAALVAERCSRKQGTINKNERIAQDLCSHSWSLYRCNDWDGGRERVVLEPCMFPNTGNNGSMVLCAIWGMSVL